MKNRTLGKSGIEVSAMGLGCWAIGGGELFTGIDDAESIRALHAALDLGVNLLDTCEGYGPDSHSEVVIGKAIKGRRDDVVLCTKFKPFRSTETEIREALEGSLKRFGLSGSLPLPGRRIYQPSGTLQRNPAKTAGRRKNPRLWDQRG